MALFYYFDNGGQKQGPFSGSQLKWFAKQGEITPDTVIENEDGKSVTAKEVKSLIFAETPPVEVNPFTAALPTEVNPFTAPVPEVPRATYQAAPAPTAKRDWISLSVNIIGFLLIAAVVGIVGKLIYDNEVKKANPPDEPPPVVAPEVEEEPPVVAPVPPANGRGRRPARDNAAPQIDPAEEERKAEEARRRAEEERRAEEAKRRAEEERRAEEAKRRAEERQRAERAVRLAGAVDLEKEMSRRGFKESGRLFSFVQYGIAGLSGKLSEEDKNYKQIDILEVARKEEALQRVNRVKAEIKAEQEKIAKMAFFHDYTYGVHNVAVYGDTSSFTMLTNEIGSNAIRFSGLKAEEISLPEPGITCNTAEVRSINDISLSLRGNTDSIRALARNNNDYRVRVWFENLRIERGTSVAAVLKVEVVDVRVGAVPERLGGGQAVQGSQDGFNKFCAPGTKYRGAFGQGTVRVVFEELIAQDPPTVKGTITFSDPTEREVKHPFTVEGKNPVVGKIDNSTLPDRGVFRVLRVPANADRNLQGAVDNYWKVLKHYTVINIRFAEGKMEFSLNPGPDAVLDRDDPRSFPINLFGEARPVR